TGAGSRGHDARRLCRQLGLALHRVNFADAYKQRVFTRFLEEYRRGRTPNPDVLCNREIKFGVLRSYAQRLGGRWLATGHYARTVRAGERLELHKGCDPGKDQSYFLHALAARHLSNVMFPLGEKLKSEVRGTARQALLRVAEKKDSTGICFIGERPFAAFLSRYLPMDPGEIKDPNGRVLGTHRGLAGYTLGQRQGLGIGGLADRPQGAWYVAAKDPQANALIVVQGHDHPLLYQNWLTASGMHWINGPPPGWSQGAALQCRAKTRYRQPDQPCTAFAASGDSIEVRFAQPQRAVTPGQYVVLYQGTRCLGGATIEAAQWRSGTLEATA
ncbi:MAG: tRNA 2-thiouridine(34) synthase MnmA, partial [Rhodospirillaceae bacterium]|nr:tRNA 2-thiouridine(34) synthase MnmA [Rhodospirillaceae bacterium]